jgi:hypothetical protein
LRNRCSTKYIKATRLGLPPTGRVKKNGGESTWIAPFFISIQIEKRPFARSTNPPGPQGLQPSHPCILEDFAPGFVTREKILVRSSALAIFAAARHGTTDEHALTLVFQLQLPMLSFFQKTLCSQSVAGFCSRLRLLHEFRSPSWTFESGPTFGCRRHRQPLAAGGHGPRSSTRRDGRGRKGSV